MIHPLLRRQTPSQRQQRTSAGVRSSFPLSVVIGLCLTAGQQSAFAQTAIENALRAQERAVREAQQRQQPAADVFIKDEAPSGEVPSTQADEKCFGSMRIELVGHTANMGPEPQAILQSYQATCLSAPRVNALLGELNRWYQRAGWITTRVYVSEQKLASGDLQLRVVPGRIEQYQINQSETDARIQSAFPSHDGLLNLRDLEQGLENINRLPSQQGKFKLYPGKETGSSQVMVNVDDKPRVRLSEMVDNSGTAALGKWKSTTEIAVDNLSQNNDQLAIGYIRNLDQGSMDAVFQGGTLNYLIPLGYHLFSVSASLMDIHAPTGVGALIVGREVSITAQDVHQEGAAIQALDSLSINASGQVSGSGSYSGGTSVAIVAASVDLQNASVQSAGWLKLETSQGDLNLTATQISAAGNATVKSAGELNLLAEKHEAHVVRKDGSTRGEVKFETSNITAGGNLTLESANDLTVQGSKLSAGQNLKVESTGGSVDLQAVTNTEDTQVNTSKEYKFFGMTFKTSQSTSSHQEDVQGVELTSGGNTQVKALGDLTAESLKLRADGDAALGAAGAVAITSGQEYSRTQTSSDVRQSLQTDRSVIDAVGKVTIYGQQAVALSATTVEAGGKALVQSQGDIDLGYNTDTEQHNWTTSSSSSSYGGLKKKTTTTQHETADKTAEVTKIDATEVQVLGNNITSLGADITGQNLVQVEGVGKTALYAVNDEHLTKADSKSTSSWLGITYSNSKSSDSNLNTTALGTTLTSQEAIKVGVGTVTQVKQPNSIKAPVVQSVIRINDSPLRTDALVGERK